MNHPLDLLVMPYAFKPDADEVSAIERLKQAFASHAAHESEFLKVYTEEGRKQASPLVKFVLQLIADEEEAHHGMLDRVVARLDADLGWRKDPRAMPVPGEIAADERVRLRDLTDRFIAEEKQGIAQCKALMTMSGGVYAGLLTLLLRMIVHDSEKHIMMLEFIRTRLCAPE